jgi:hypothetical protein
LKISTFSENNIVSVEEAAKVASRVLPTQLRYQKWEVGMGGGCEGKIHKHLFVFFFVGEYPYICCFY